MPSPEQQDAVVPLKFNLGVTEVPGLRNAPDTSDDDTLLNDEDLRDARVALDGVLCAIAQRHGHGRCPTSLSNQEFRRAYMDALWKVNTLIKQDEAHHAATEGNGQQQGLINVGCCNRGIQDRNRPAATCMALSALVSGAFLGLAVLYQVGAAAWVNGSHQDLEGLRDLGYKKFEGDDALYYDVAAARGTTCTVERRWAGEQILEDFWGWADDSGFEPPVKNYGIKHVWCGLMLGVVFGFLDNFGLFYGLDALNGVFYAAGYRVALNIMELAGAAHLESFEADNNSNRNSKKKAKLRPTGLLLAYNAHIITEGLMSGLGNTFSGVSAPPAPSASPSHACARLQTCSACCSARPRSRLQRRAWESIRAYGRSTSSQSCWGVSWEPSSPSSSRSSAASVAPATTRGSPILAAGASSVCFSRCSLPASPSVRSAKTSPSRLCSRLRSCSSPSPCCPSSSAAAPRADADAVGLHSATESATRSRRNRSGAFLTPPPWPPTA